MSDLWITASADAEDEINQRKFATARVACAEYWPFVARATSESELDHGLSLISDGVTARVETIAESPAEVAVLARKVLDGFTGDWDAYVASREASLVSQGAMTRRHFNAIAQELHKYQQKNGQVQGLSKHWANAVSQGNQYADPSRFANAADRGTAGSVNFGMPPMTKQHFETVANTIATGPREHREGLAKHFAEALKSSNPAFNPDQFMRRARGDGDPSPKVAPKSPQSSPKTSASQCGHVYPHATHTEGNDMVCDQPKGHDGSHQDHSQKGRGEILEWSKDTKSARRIATIEDAPAAAAQMGWAYPADQQTDTSPELQNAVNAWEGTDRNTRVNEGNGIGVSDNSSGPNIEGPGQNQGIDPLIMSTHADEEAGLPKGAYRIDAFGGLHIVASINCGQCGKDMNPADAAAGGWLDGKDPTCQSCAKKNQKSVTGSVIDGYSDDPETLQRQKEHDEKFQKRHTQEQVDRLHGDDQKTSSLRVQAVQVAQRMVDEMPKEASLYAIEKEMRRRTAAFEMESDDVELVVSAALDHARSRLDFSRVAELSDDRVNAAYERHMQWSKENGHDPDTVNALKAHEKAKGITRAEANGIADLNYIGGGDSDWRSQKDAAVHVAYPDYSEQPKGGWDYGTDHNSHEIYKHPDDDETGWRHVESDEGEDCWNPTPHHGAKESSRFRRVLDKVLGVDKGPLEKCPICGKKIPKSEFDRHIAEAHPHEVNRHGSRTAAGDPPNPFDPAGGSPPPMAAGPDMNPDEGGGVAQGDQGLGSGTQAPKAPVGQSAAQDGIEPTQASSSPPRTKPADNPNATPPMQQQPMMPGMPQLGGQPGIMTSPQMMAARKIAEIAEGVLETNPGMSEDAAVTLAKETVALYPSVIRSEAYGGSDYPAGDSKNRPYFNCPQCSHKAFDARTNHCHNCGYVDVHGAAPDSSSAWDPLAGPSTVKPGPRNLRNPGIR